MSQGFKVVRQVKDSIHQRHKQANGETIATITMLLYHFLEHRRTRHI